MIQKLFFRLCAVAVVWVPAQAQIQMTYTAPPLPVVDAGNDVTTTSGTPVQLQATVSGGTAQFTYAWSPTAGLDDPTIANPTATVTATTTYTVTVTDDNGCEGSDEVSVIVSGIGIDENALASLSLYPNPSDGRISLDLPENIRGSVNANLYNTNGQLVLNDQLEAGKQTRDWQNLPDGVYFLRLGNETFVHTYKLVIQKR